MRDRFGNQAIKIFHAAKESMAVEVVVGLSLLIGAVVTIIVLLMMCVEAK